MTPEQLASYREAEVRGPRIHVEDLDVGDHTLTTGYNLDGTGDVHVYVMDDLIHLVIYQGDRLIHHWSGESADPVNLIPSKRAYPHTTNETFALLMRGLGHPLTFIGNFD